MKIVCLDGLTLYPVEDSRWRRFEDFGEFEVFDRTFASDIVERCKDADMVLTNKTPMSADTIKALPNLKYIGVLATGYNVVDVEAAHQASVVVTNIPAYSTDSVAQHVFSLLLGITNRVEHYSHAVEEGRWAECRDFTFRDFEWTELAGKTFGIAGLGSIGSAVARIATAFGMKVAVWTSKNQDELPEGYTKVELDELFSVSDVLSFHCPLTPQTRNLADARRIALMKPTAILINTARGPLVDEQALAEALNAGRIFAAGVDVLSKEPPTADNPLVGARNCFITPHIAWASAEARRRLLEIALENCKAFVQGAPVNVV